MAEYLMRHLLQKEGLLRIEVFSRGVHAGIRQPMSPGAQEALQVLGIAGHAHRATMLSSTDITQADAIYALTQEHLDIILERHPQARGKAQRLANTDIADPLGGSPSDYEKCRIEIQNALPDIISKLKSEGSSQS